MSPKGGEIRQNKEYRIHEQTDEMRTSLNQKNFLLTIDVEDWFQVENLRSWNPPHTWEKRELRVEQNIFRILDLFDEMSLQSRGNGTTKSRLKAYSKEDESGDLKATFFILGWIAERLPHLVREIQNRGHEVASHGYNHELCTSMTPEELHGDLVRSRSLLEDISGKQVRGYRAPNFSINVNVFHILEKSGYTYDSSFNSFALNGRYGRVDLSQKKTRGIAFEITTNLSELPVSNPNFLGKVFPFSGGGYFRLMPLRFFMFGVKKILEQENAYVFYLHPWEIDPEQPYVKVKPRSSRFKHYVNLHKTEDKMIKFLQMFRSCTFLTCSEYIEKMNSN